MPEPSQPQPTQPEPSIQAAFQLFTEGRTQIGRIISGQQELIDQALLTLLCGGHALVEGVPGVAKTLAVKTLARFLALDFRRVQGTPDMMPADILGTSIFSPKTSEFSLHKGPVFTQFLLADEINRMPPRTQAALLESMEERQVTMDGEGHALDPYFTVFATQNPLEFEGTYPLPEAQLDRFLIKIRVPYPTLPDERSILERHHASVEPKDLELTPLTPVDPALLAAARREIRAVRIEPALFDYLLAPASGPRSPSAHPPAPVPASCSSPRPTPPAMAATSSSPTTSSRPPSRCSAIASCFAPKPSLKASTPTASSPTSSPQPPCQNNGHP
jgi:MoxR-like ATPase